MIPSTSFLEVYDKGFPAVETGDLLLICSFLLSDLWDDTVLTPFGLPADNQD